MLFRSAEQWPNYEMRYLCVTGHVQRELKHFGVWLPSPSSSGVYGLYYLNRCFPKVKAFLLPLKLLRDSSYPLRSGFHSPSRSEKDTAGCTCIAQLQLRASAGSGVRGMRLLREVREEGRQLGPNPQMLL